MLVSELITGINYALRAVDDDAPTAGDEEYTYWLATANRKKNELYEDITKQWRSSYTLTPTEVGTVSTTATTTLTGSSTFFTDYQVGDQITISGETVRTIATIPSDTSLTVTVAFSNTASTKTFTHRHIIAVGVQTYNLNRRFLAPSDTVYVTDTSGNKIYNKIIQPQERNYITDNYYPTSTVTSTLQGVFITDENPQVLTFNSDILTGNNLIGGQLFIPAYYMPPDMVAATDIVPVPDPYWLVMATASEIAFSDIIYEDRAPGINSKSNNLYTMMVRNSRRGTFGSPRVVPTKSVRISNTTYRGY